MSDDARSDEHDLSETDERTNSEAPRHDPAPQAFRAANQSDHFSKASGVLFEQAMGQTRMAICLADPKQPDVPIVFANRAFRELTGYEQDEIIGRNCRFLQGPETDPRPVEKIRDAIANEDVTVVELLNYRKDGSTFWNALHIGPIYDEDGELVYFFGSQWDVSDVRAARAEEQYARDMARELSHRMKNMFSVISGIVNITGRMRGIEDEAREINERVQALGRAYETTLDEASSGNIEIGQAIRGILEAYDVEGTHLVMHGNEYSVPFGVVSSVGLALHELAANATKHGAWTRDDGRVDVDWHVEEQDGKQMLVVKWKETGGPDVAEPEGKSGSGNQIIERMVRYGGGDTQREWAEDGLIATLTLPIGKAGSR
ncbi:PAS domain-containing protein [Aurantiacibacter aquimixticola]|uniref:histidine kinase n=1 Tax=Aurantiacibacter aquimixticola TaxID=1958945 RepID=A0A419RRB5_9SPHN|nr:PAS domain-containing protein [Aurantiacibacter aquimixticola]RJY08317.1 PAS domain-containing protein [Aurantiacibacter aquimixticola]